MKFRLLYIELEQELLTSHLLCWNQNGSMPYLMTLSLQPTKQTIETNLKRICLQSSVVDYGVMFQLQFYDSAKRNRIFHCKFLRCINVFVLYCFVLYCIV